MSKSPHSSSDREERCFETAFASLEEIVRKLEEGQLGLSESLVQYEAAVRYLKLCHEALAQAERKIMILTGIDAEGNAITEPLDDTSLTLEEKQDRRAKRRSSSAGDERPKRGEEASEIDNQRGLF
jgi:exodeoxyribonuclease VII small subunit